MRVTPNLRSERGIALVVSVFALVVIGALVAGTFFVGRIEQITGYNSVWAGQAAEGAEAGLAHAQANVDASTYLSLPVWTPAAPTEMAIPARRLTSSGFGISSGGGVAFTDTIRRLNNTLFMVRSAGQLRTPSGQVMAEQSLGALMRIAKPTIGVNAAVTVQDPIKFNGNSFEVDGFNSIPPQWGAGECAAVDAGNSDDVVGIRSSTSTGAGAQDMNNIFGFPAKTVDNDPTITSATFQDFLDYTYTTLASQPGVKTLPLTTPYNGVGPILDGTQSPAVCDKSVLLNFGEPFRNPPTAGAIAECEGYFPIVHGTGSQTKFASGSRGQGILLIDGDMEIVGGFEWVGLIIVRNEMKVTGTGNKIYGAVLTEGASVNTAGSIGGNVEVHYSACGIENAVNGVAVAVPLSRGWTQLF